MNIERHPMCGHHFSNLQSAILSERLTQDDTQQQQTRIVNEMPLPKALSSSLLVTLLSFGLLLMRVSSFLLEPGLHFNFCRFANKGLGLSNNPIRRCVPSVPKRRSRVDFTPWTRLFETSFEQGELDFPEGKKDYLVFDSLHLDDADRPSLLEVLSNPRDILALTLIAVAAGISVCNVLGNYSTIYLLLEKLSVLLGVLSGLAGLLQVATGYKISRPSDFNDGRRRRGLADDSTVNMYASAYALTVSWLAFRASSFCPNWLISLDSILPLMAIGVFFLAVAVPVVTLFNPGRILDESPPLSETELLRMRGLLAIGILASVFGPDCYAFASGGSEWWDRVTAMHSSQQTLESSTSLFALYANEASMVSHRCGRAGVAPFQVIVPSFAAVCFLLAFLPCVAALYWLGNDVSFFSFYGE